jgi:hypothetical protein
MGMVDITTFHGLWRGDLELSPSLETESSSLRYFTRMACNDGDPLLTMPLTTVPESTSSGAGNEVWGFEVDVLRLE